MNLVDRYLRDKYTDAGTTDDDRFQDQRGEYHASNVASCPREWYWQFKRGSSTDEWSPYFELGRVYELIFGGVLAWEHGDFDVGDLKWNQPWELAEMSDRIHQDVGVEIILEDDIRIVGESDWTLFEYGADIVDKVVLDTRTGERTGFRDGEEVGYDGQIETVFESKTTKKIQWRERYGHKQEHLYQVQVYMWAMDAKGEIPYVTRNELDYKTFEFFRDEKIEQDIEIRVRRHHQNLLEDEPPDTDPLGGVDDPESDSPCKWCEYQDECKDIGGSVWDD